MTRRPLPALLAVAATLQWLAAPALAQQGPGSLPPPSPQTPLVLGPNNTLGLQLGSGLTNNGGYLQVGPPTATTLGGVRAGAAPSGQAVTGVDTSGNPIFGGIAPDLSQTVVSAGQGGTGSTSAAGARAAFSLPPVVSTQAAMQGLDVSAFSAGFALARSNAPPSWYFYQAATCSKADGGQQMAGTGAQGGCFTKYPEHEVDCRTFLPDYSHLGNYNIARMVTSSANVLTLASALANPVYVGDMISVTARNYDCIPSAANNNCAAGTSASTGSGAAITYATKSGPTVYGTVTAVSGLSVTIALGAHSPALSTIPGGIAQLVTTWEDDTAQANLCYQFAGSLVTFAGSFVSMSSGGATFGMSGPLSESIGGVQVNHMNLIGLNPDGFTSGNGLYTVLRGNDENDHLGAYSGNLPIQQFISQNVNGNTVFSNIIGRDMQGTIATATLTGASTTAGSRVVQTTAAVTTGGPVNVGFYAGNGAACPTFTFGQAGAANCLNDYMFVHGGTLFQNGTALKYVDTNNTSTKCANTACLLMGQPAQATATNQTITFSVDPMAVASFGAGSGIHLFNANVTQKADLPEDHYGCALYHDGTQSTVIRSITDQGASSVCLDRDTASIVFLDAHIYNNNYPASYANVAAMNISAGAVTIEMPEVYFGGILRYDMFAATAPRLHFGTGQWNQANSAVTAEIQFVAYGTVNDASLRVEPMAEVPGYTTPLVAYLGEGTCGTDYTYATFQGLSVNACSAIAFVNTMAGNYLAVGRGKLETLGAGFLGGALSEWTFGQLKQIASYTPTWRDCGSVTWLANGNTSLTITLPTGLALLPAAAGYPTMGNYNMGSSCALMFMSNETAQGSVAVVPGAGVTMYSGGASVSSLTLPAQRVGLCLPYQAGTTYVCTVLP